MNPQIEGRVFALASAVCSGTITEKQQHELGELLSTSEKLQQLYVLYLDIHRSLGEQLAVSESQRADLDRNTLFNETIAISSLLFPSVEVPAAKKGSASSGRVRALRWSLAAAVVLLVIAPFWTNESDKGTMDELTNMKVEHVSLNAGTLTLQLPDVGTLVVDGPADLDIVGARKLRLDRGRIKLRVTEPSGHGFVVSTPHGDVTDLGTEFAVDASDERMTNLVVFDGMVDLAIPRGTQTPMVERLIQGEGVRFGRGGQLSRISSIVTGQIATFRTPGDITEGMPKIIKRVTDNLSPDRTKRFYEIVPDGMREDATAYVDRPYEWNGIDTKGMPHFLRGAEYVKTFNDHKFEPLEIEVEVSKACRLYLLWDIRVPLPKWVLRDFFDTGQMIGLDETNRTPLEKQKMELGHGAGVSVDNRFMIWSRDIDSPGTVLLGPLTPEKPQSSNYAFAVVPLEE